jgi:hypothetical protein
MGASDMVMVPDFRTAKAAKIFFRHVRASAILAIGFPMVDPLHLKLGMQVIPSPSFISVDYGALGNARLDPRLCRAFRAKYSGDAITVPLAHNHHDLTLARLVGP